MKIFNQILIFIIALFLTGCKLNQVDQKILVKDFEIICNETLLDSIYSNFSEQIYIPVKFVKNSDTVDAKMRIRGDSSRKYKKKSLKIKFNKDEIPKGERRKINLNSEWTDKTYIRQYMSSVLMKKAGVICFESSFVRLKLNGEFWGLYLQVENIDKNFLEYNYLETQANLYKATKDGACLSIFDDIHKKWEKKRNKKQPWTDLHELIYTLDTLSVNNYHSFLKENFEYDKFISLLALNMLLQNGSTYYHNYYMYHDINGNGKWQIFPWDLDKTFGFYNYKPYKYHETSSNWESDNPLIEKAFLSEEVKNDIISKIQYLDQNIFNEKELYPIINTCEKVLEDAVESDQTDQIENVKVWKKHLKNEKKYIKNQADYILKQFKTLLPSFKVYNSIDTCLGNYVFTWEKPKTNIPLQFEFLIGQHVTLEDEKTKTISAIKDTFIYLTDLKPGLYYWRVHAYNSENKIEGFNTKNTLHVLPIKKRVINKDTILLEKDSPHVIDCHLNIKSGATLSIEKGAEIRLSNEAKILNYGIINAQGSAQKPIILKPSHMFWDKIVSIGNTSQLKMNYCEIEDGFITASSSNLNFGNCKFKISNKQMLQNGERASLIWTNKGEISIDSCSFENMKLSTGEGLNINFSKALVRNSVFKGISDAVEYLNVTDGEISGNIIINSPDDAIDLNGCDNVIVKNNVIAKNADKAISIGTEQYGPSTNIQVYDNLLIDNSIGVSVKDSSSCVISNTVFFGNKLALNAYLKNNVKTYEVGGTARVTECLFYNNEELIYTDENSEIIISNSVSDDKKLSGEGNKIEREEFNLNDDKLSNMKYVKIDSKLMQKWSDLKN